MKQYTLFKRSKTVLCICAALFLGSFSLHAQLNNLFGSPSGKSKNGKEVPTVINSDAMDMDMANNKIILLGNVDVLDNQKNIKCRKMIIYLDKKKDTPKTSAAAKKTAPQTGTGGVQDGSSVSKIECIGDVVITQKEEDGVVTQQAFAGKATYFAAEEKIILQENPVVVKGTSRLEGETITLYTKTNRVLVVKPVSTFRSQPKDQNSQNQSN